MARAQPSPGFCHCFVAPMASVPRGWLRAPAGSLPHLSRRPNPCLRHAVGARGGGLWGGAGCTRSEAGPDLHWPGCRAGVSACRASSLREPHLSGLPPGARGAVGGTFLGRWTRQAREGVLHAGPSVLAAGMLGSPLSPGAAPPALQWGREGEGLPTLPQGAASPGPLQLRALCEAAPPAPPIHRAPLSLSLEPRTADSGPAGFHQLSRLRFWKQP